jgi:hypothetical protein
LVKRFHIAIEEWVLKVNWGTQEPVRRKLIAKPIGLIG